MTVFVLFKYLHILTMFAAVAAAMIPEVVLHAVARRGDVAAVRGLVPVVSAVGRLIPILFMVGLVFGLIAAVTGELDLLRPWLVASYVVFAIAMATGVLLSGPWAKGVADAALASPTDAYSPELEQAVHDRRGLVSTAILMTAIAVIVFLMVAQPGG